MGRVIELFIDQFLAIDQADPASNPQGQSVSQVISFTDTAKNYRTVLEVSQTVPFGQTIELRRSIFHLTATNYFAAYQQGASGPQLQTLVQFFHIGQEAKVVKFEQLLHSLLISQAVMVTTSKVAMNTLVMVDTASCNTLRSIMLTHTLYVGSSGSGYLLDQEFYSIVLPSLSGPNTPECR